MKNKELKQYCYKCGAEMIGNKVISHYICMTGEPVIEIKWVCPNRKWYNFFHSKFISDVDGMVPYYYRVF